MKKCKKILAIILSAILLLAVVPTSIFAEEVEIIDVSIPELEVIENYNGGWQDGYNDQEGDWVEKRWFEYNYEPKNITVTYSDNSTQTFEEFWEAQVAIGEISFYAVQKGENPWQAGNSYTASITLAGDTEFPYTVTVVENPVENITVEPVEVMENRDGYWQDDVEYAYFYYYTLPEQITVEFKNGESFTGRPDDLYNETGYDYNYGSDQSYENQWGVGTHTAWFSVLGVTVECPVTVVESPIASITVDDIEIIENSNGSFDGYYDQENNWVENSWYRYNLEPEYITVELKNGDTIDGYLWEICEEFDCYDYGYDSDQSYENQWGIGSHTATFKFMGFKADYNVEIVESPIESVTVEDITHIVGTGGWISESEVWNEETEEYEWVEWYNYEVRPEYIIVELNDGETVEGDYSEVCEELGYEGDYWSDQYYDNQWGVGTHTATLNFMGVETDYNVIIEESPIESIEVEDLEIIEGSHQYYSNKGYYNFYNHDLKGTITFKDGTTKSVSESFYIDEESYNVEVYTPDQSGEEPWTAGNTYEATASVMGISTTFNVTITETPIESFVLEDVILYEGIDTYDNGDYEEYSFFVKLSQVLLKDGTNSTIDEYGDFVYNGEYYWVYCDDKQYEEPWEVGNTYEVTGYLLGKSATFNVTIKENPIEALQVVKNPDNAEVLKGGSLNLKGAVIRIKYTDGTYEDISINHDFTYAYRKEFELKKIDRTSWLNIYNFFNESDDSFAEIELFGKTCQIPVTVKANLMESISIREAADKFIIITVQNSDNTSYDMKVLDLSFCWIMDDGEYYASILTDKGQFDAYIYANEDSFAIELFGAPDEGTYERNIFQSNSIGASDWFETSYYMLCNQLPLVDLTYGLEDYTGVITAKNIDRIIDIAYLIKGIDGYRYGEPVSGDTIRAIVTECFAVDDIDLTLSEKYDAENDLYTYYDNTLGGGELMKERPDDISYSNGVWTVTVYPAGIAVSSDTGSKNKAYTFKLNDDLQILGYSIKQAGAELREENGVMYYYENGVKSDATGIVEYEGKQMYINKGRFLGASGLVTIDGKKMYINKGYFTGASGLVTISGKKTYINKGYFTGASGLVTIDGKKMYINKGYFTGASGLVTISGKKMYINKGYFTGASGLVTVSGKKMYINKGYFTGASGLVTISGKKMYINKGYFTGATGIVTISGKKHYINKGYFTGASGKVKVNGKTYTVVNGIVK